MIELAWVALSLLDHVGGRTLRALIAQFGSPQAVLDASPQALRRVPGVGPRIAASIRAVDLAQVERALAGWREAGVRVITLDDPDYPRRLRALDDAPPTLFVRGAWPPPVARAAAVVGTREPTPTARAAASILGAELAARGWMIVSGLAVGVDAAAHLGALAVPQGYTLAALGSGVLNVYPPVNRMLAQAVLKRGALVSEAPPPAKPAAARLVARNRIISGLAEALIVVETDADGGAMHAARFARAQGRPVYALDLPASGNRALLADGARPLHRDLGELLDG